MTKKMIKIVVMLLAIVFVVSFVGNVFSTESTDGYNIGQFGGIVDNTGASGSVTKIVGSIINIAQIVGTGVAIIMLIVLAIKYISAAPGDKAEIKKHAVVYIVGAIVLFAASGILGIIKNFSNNIEAT